MNCSFGVRSSQHIFKTNKNKIESTNKPHLTSHLRKWIHNLTASPENNKWTHTLELSIGFHQFRLQGNGKVWGTTASMIEGTEKRDHYCLSSILSFESYFSNNFCGTAYFLLVTTTLKLAQVSFLLDELGVVVLAVESALMRNVVRWADRTPSMCAFEAHLVVRSTIHRNLLSIKFNCNVSE